MQIMKFGGDAVVAGQDSRSMIAVHRPTQSPRQKKIWNVCLKG